MKTLILTILIILTSELYSQNIPQDKVLHIVAGSTITYSATILSYKAELSKHKSVILGFSLGILAGGAKEAYDIKNGTTSFSDFAYTCAGSSVSSLSLTFMLKRVE